jgi:hypothetical protein
VAGAGAVAGDHQPPPVLRWDRGDRLVQDLQVIGGGVRAGAARAQHPGQRLSGVVAVSQQGVMAEPFVIGLGSFLLRARRGDSGIQPDADHPPDLLVRDRDAGDRAVAALDARPCMPAGRVDGPGYPGLRLRAAGRDLVQRPPGSGHRGDRPGHFTQATEDREIADHHRAAGDRHRQVRQHPAPVMDQQPRGRQRLRQTRRQVRLVSQVPQ